MKKANPFKKGKAPKGMMAMGDSTTMKKPAAKKAAKKGGFVPFGKKK